MAEPDEAARMRAGVGARVVRIARQTGGGLRRLTPAGVLALLCAGAFGPVVVPGIVGTTMIGAAVGVLGSVGGNVLTDLVLRTVRRSRERADQEKIEDELALAIETALLVGDPDAAALRADIAAVMREIDGVRAAVEAVAAVGDGDLHDQFRSAVTTLGADFAEFRFVLADVSAAAATIQDTLSRQDVEHRADRDRARDLMLEMRLLRETVGVVERRTRSLTEQSDDARVWSDGPPYRGLLAFEQDHESVYYGRERLTMKLVGRAAERLTGPGLIAVTGASGAGKSSLVLAGFLPAVARGLLPGAEGWPRVVMTPTRAPLDELAAQLAALGAAKALTLLESRPEQAPLLIRQALLAQGASRLVLVVDQFEEIFTYAQDEPGTRQRDPFLAALLAAATVPVGPAGEPAALVLCCVRGDFWDRCAEIPQLAELLDEAQFAVGPMSEPDLRRAITGPAAAAGVEIEPGLTDCVLDDLRSLTGSAAFEIGVLPLLSQAMLVTWHNKEGNRLTLRGYGRTGGVAHAVTTSAEQSYTGLSDVEQEVARSVFRRLTLVSPDGQINRRRATRQELHETHDPATVDRVLTAFAGQRLVILGDGVVEIAHDALVRAWPRLREWLADSQADRLVFGRLFAASARWVAQDHDKSLLPRGSELNALTRAVDRWEAAPDSYPDLAVDPDSRAFLTAATRATRRGGLIRRAVTVLLAGLLVATGTFAIIAARNADTAREQRNLALSRQLVAQSEAVLDTDPVLAQQLALAAWRLSPSPAARVAMLSGLNTRARATLTAHKGSVNAVAFSPDGRTLASAGDDNTVLLWDTTTRRPVATLTANDGGLDGVAEIEFSPDGRTLATVEGEERRVWLWDVATRRPIGRLPVDDRVNGIAFSPDGQTLATAVYQMVLSWDVGTRRQAGTLANQPRLVTQLAFSSDGRMLATAGGDLTTRLWDVATGQQLGDPMSDSAFGTCLFGLDGIAFAADGKTLAASCAGTTVLWDTTTHQRTGTLPDTVNVVFSPDGHTMAAVADNTVRLLTTLRGEIGVFAAHIASVYDAAFSPDGRMLATASADGTVRLWDTTPVQQLEPAPDNAGGEVYMAVFSPDGRMVATANDDGTVRLWDIATHQQIGDPVPGDITYLHRMAFSPDGRFLATANVENTVRLWDVVTHKQVAELTGHDGQVFGLAFSPDGRTLATGDDDGTMRLWDTVTHKQFDEQNMSWGTVYDVAFSPDGRTLAIVSGRVVFLRNATTREDLGSLDGHVKSVYSVAFSPDSRTLATASEDGTLRLWDNRTHQQLGVPLRGDDSRAYEVAFAPDGQTLAMATDDNVWLWDVASRQRIAGPVKGQYSAAFSPDGRTLATVVGDAVWLWPDMRHDNPADTICAQAGPLTQQAWTQHSPGEPLPRLCP